jgi:phage/conjugal plasmid C-4 type zinc finger TraR family protein
MDGFTLQQIKDSLLARWKRMGKDKKDRQSEISADNYLNPPHAEVIDIAQSLEQIGRDTSLQEAERRELLAIERALTKMATGSFGMCEECGEEIPSKRLVVLPEARLCAHCQAYEERQNSRTRSPGMAAG